MLKRLLTPRNILMIYMIVIGTVFIVIVLRLLPQCTIDDGSSTALETHLRTWELALQSAEIELRRYEQAIPPVLLQRSIVSSYIDAHRTELPMIYVITPTYARSTQKADLTRLVNTLLHVSRLHWVLVEDAAEKSTLVARLLQFSRLAYTHLSVVTPVEYQRNESDPRWYRPRGVLQRNAGIEWIRKVKPSGNKGVIYFADDDNSYDVRLFAEMRHTLRVSVWPVGLVGNLRYEKPIVNARRVTGWFTYWKPQRRFATDMAGFAISIRLLFEHPTAEFSSTSRRGEQESDFLAQLLVGIEELEPKANNCSEVLVWHTRTEPSNLSNELKLKRKGLTGSDPSIEV